MVSIGGPYAVKGMMSNPLSTPQYWKPSTFGGDIGFNIVKSASIKKLFCQNMLSGECQHIAFHLPEPSGVDSKMLTPAISSTFQSSIEMISTRPSTVFMKPSNCVNSQYYCDLPDKN